MTKQVVLYKIPEILDVAKVLDDSILEAYNDSIKCYNEKAKATLGKFNKTNGELTGSNPFMLVHLVNSNLLPKGERLATRKDLEIAISLDNDFLRGNYTDFGLALRTAGDSYKPNDLLAKTLFDQLKKRRIKLGEGKLIPLSSLKLTQDNNSAYGLTFNLNEQSNLIRDMNDFKWNYTKNEGLACAYLYRGRIWYSNGEGLAYSNSCGRVVVVSAEGTSQKILDNHLIKLQKVRDEEIAKIKDKYVKAEAILKGK